jgi:adenosylmethionine-8-amino-7-oxononanoate aminotransferase
VKDIRIKGAIGAVQMENPVNTTALSTRFQEEGVFIRPFGDIIYVTPAFIIEQAELATLTGAIRRIVEAD